MILGDGKHGTIRGRVRHRFEGRNPWGDAAKVEYFVCHRVDQNGECERDANGELKVCIFRKVGRHPARSLCYQADLLREIIKLVEERDEWSTR